MPFRFRRGIRIGPGVRVTIGRRGLSTLFGRRGARITLGGHGNARATVRTLVPGVFYSTTARRRRFPRATWTAWLFGAAGVLALLLSLTGCLEDQKRSMAQCREAQRAGGISLTISEEARKTELCMKAAGYEPSTMDSGCDSADEIVRGLDARCYLPTKLVDRLMTMVEYTWAGEE
jgi:hypothetical protein